MTIKERRQPRRTTAADGSPIVELDITGINEPAIFDAEDFDDLMERGVSDQMFLNWDGKRTSCCVRASAPWLDNIGSPARIIMGAAGGQVVRYLDHNPLNLRHSNLFVDRGFAKGREADALRIEDAIADFATPAQIATGA